MRPRHVLSTTATAALFAAACVPWRSSGPSPAQRAAGVYSARVAVTGRSTYTGSLDLAQAGRDSVTGFMRLTSPISVDVKLGGRTHNDSLTLIGTYTGANGCAGDFRATLFTPTAQSGSGPFELGDKCVGKLVGTMTVTR